MNERLAVLGELNHEVAYGATGMIYAHSVSAWNEILTTLTAAEAPQRKPWLVAGYQSEEEAEAELDLTAVPVPGNRSADQLVKVKVSRSVYEPDIQDPMDAWHAATQLIRNPRFLNAREALYDLEDRLHTDASEPHEIEVALDGAVEEYRDAVREAHKQLRRRRFTTVFSWGVGAGVGAGVGVGVAAIGLPHVSPFATKGVTMGVTSSIMFVAGRLFPVGEPIHPEQKPGAALDMIGAAFRSAQTQPA
jgi:hypothetical protein